MSAFTPEQLEEIRAMIADSHHAPTKPTTRPRSAGCEAPNRTLPDLRSELTRLLAQAREPSSTLADLTVETPAIAAGKRTQAAWSTLQELAQDYKRIRAQYIDYLKNEDPAVPLNLSATRHFAFADAFEIDPFWTDRRRAAADSAKGSDASTLEYADWLRNVPRTPAMFIDRLHPMVELAHITLFTQPWLPSREVLTEAFQTAQAALAPPERGNILYLKTSRDRLYRITGTTRTPAQPAPDAMNRFMQDTVKRHGTRTK